MLLWSAVCINKVEPGSPRNPSGEGMQMLAFGSWISVALKWAGLVGHELNTTSATHNACSDPHIPHVRFTWSCGS